MEKDCANTFKPRPIDEFDRSVRLNQTLVYEYMQLFQKGYRFAYVKQKHAYELFLILDQLSYSQDGFSICHNCKILYSDRNYTDHVNNSNRTTFNNLITIAKDQDRYQIMSDLADKFRAFGAYYEKEQVFILYPYSDSIKCNYKDIGKNDVPDPKFQLDDIMKLYNAHSNPTIKYSDPSTQFILNNGSLLKKRIKETHYSNDNDAIGNNQQINNFILELIKLIIHTSIAIYHEDSAESHELLYECCKERLVEFLDDTKMTYEFAIKLEDIVLAMEIERELNVRESCIKYRNER